MSGFEDIQIPAYVEGNCRNIPLHEQRPPVAIYKRVLAWSGEEPRTAAWKWTTFVLNRLPDARVRDMVVVADLTKRIPAAVHLTV
jgi:hypothetical protein